MNSAAIGVRGAARDVRYLRPEPSLPLPRRRSRRGWRRLAFAALRCMLAVCVILAMREAARQITTSRTFDLKQVLVEGCGRADPGEIRAAVKRAPGRNLFDIDLSAVRRLVEEHPWVLRAEVRRRFPHTVSVTITERTPAGVALLDGRAMVVDGEGFALAECGTLPERCDSPVLTGLEGLEEHERKARISAGVRALATVSRLAPNLSKRISEVDLSRPDRIALLPGDGRAPLYLSPEDHGRNIENYLSVKNEIDRRFEKLDYVDLRFRGRIAVMPAALSTAAKGSGTGR